ncbi:ras-responsive element-binding protein 1 [Nephila pilipes]|uniref:Ras-responsive element-binding protein 1 n=1 Tax=Nephila pilipes TaxID=299642 RepID=A0A8X6UG18_NEPPI|nr:ras-responsive element-binding protein 1 [Nephila pilipes]
MSPQAGGSNRLEVVTENSKPDGDNTVVESQKKGCTTRSQFRNRLKRKGGSLKSNPKRRKFEETKILAINIEEAKCKNSIAESENVRIGSEKVIVEFNDEMPKLEKNEPTNEKSSNIDQGENQDTSDKVECEINNYFEICICTKKFYDALTFHNHIKTHNQEGNLACGMCGDKLCSVSSRDRHMVVHSKLRLFTCKICDKLFTTNGNMNRHLVKHKEGAQKSRKIKRKTSEVFKNSEGIKKRKIMKNKELESEKIMTLEESKNNIYMNENSPQEDQKNMQAETSTRNESEKEINSDKCKNYIKKEKINFNESKNNTHMKKCKENYENNLQEKQKDFEKLKELTRIDFSIKTFPIYMKLTYKTDTSTPIDSVKKNKCPVCRLSFSNAHYLEQHKKSHETAHIVCAMCDCYFLTESQKKFHFEEHHSDRALMECKRFFNGLGLTRTYSTSHSSEQLKEDSEQWRIPEIQLEEVNTPSNEQIEVVLENDSINQINLSPEGEQVFAPVTIENIQIHREVNTCLNESIKIVTENDSNDEMNPAPEQAVIEKNIPASNSSSLNQAPVIHSDLADISDILLNVRSVPSSASATSDNPALVDAISQQEKSTKKPYNCPQCCYGSSDKSSLKRHIQIHSKKTSFLCKICEKIFTNKNNAERHARELHKLDKRELITDCIIRQTENSNSSDEEKRVCKFCKETFENEQALQYHLRSKNCMQKPYKCKKCGTGSSTKHNCFRHIKKQHGELFRDGISDEERNKIKNDYTIETEKITPAGRAETLELNTKQAISDIKAKEFSNSTSTRENVEKIYSFNEDDREDAVEGLLSLSDCREISENLSSPIEAPLDLSVRALDLSGNNKTSVNLLLSDEKSSSSNSTIHKTKDIYNDHKITNTEFLIKSTAEIAYSQHVQNNKKIEKSKKPSRESIEQKEIKNYKCELCDKNFAQKSNMNRHIKTQHYQMIKSRTFQNIETVNPTVSTITKNALQNRILKHSENISPLINSNIGCEEPFLNKYLHKSGLNISYKQESNSDLENEDLASISSVVSNVHNQKLPLDSVNHNSMDMEANEMFGSHNKGTINLSRNEKRDQCCSSCDQSFLWRSSLQRHSVTHTGAKPFKCQDCNKHYSTTSNRNRHAAKHIQFKNPFLGLSRLSDQKPSVHAEYSETIKKTSLGESPMKNISSADRCIEAAQRLVEAKSINHSVKDLECQFCNTSYKSCMDLMNHIKELHHLEYVKMQGESHELPDVKSLFKNEYSKIRQ